jgi:scyllo-inositol 2-dehydrogenase (NADP+)
MNVGIIGFGRIGAEHAGWITAAGLSVMAVQDVTAARRELAVSRGFRAVADVDELLGDRSIDTVLIATPSSMHLEHASRAIEARKHVMIEKPMALRAADCRSLEAMRERAGVTMSVFHCRRFDIDYLTVRSAIDSESLGRVFNVESRLGQWASCVGPAAREFRPGWRNEASFGGGGLFDWGSHFADQLWRLLWPAKPVAVFAQLRGNVWTRDCDDFARVLINFDTGATGLMEINTTTTRPLPRWHLDGERGSTSSPFSLEFDTHRWAQLTHTAVDGATTTMPLAAPGLSEPAIWKQFARACVSGTTPAITVRSVIQTMELLDAARDSSTRGVAIPIDSSAWVLD